MKCSRVRDELATFLSGELEDLTRQRIEEHLATCEMCDQERVKLQTLETQLRRGFAQKVPATEGRVVSWLQKEVKEMDRQKTKQEYGGVKRAGRGEVATRSRRWGLPVMKAVAACMVFLFLAVASWPVLVRASADLPLVGAFVERLVLSDSGLSWAYQHGYIGEPLVDVRHEGMRLKILGAVGDPVQTTVFYLLDGVEPDEEQLMAVVADDDKADWIPALRVATVNGESVSSWGGQPYATPLGLVGMVHTHALSDEGEAMLVLEGPNGLIAQIAVSRCEITDLSHQYSWHAGAEQEGVRVEGVRVIRTPGQVRVDYQLFHGHHPIGPRVQEHQPHLLLRDGTKLYAERAFGSRDEGGHWNASTIFSGDEDSLVDGGVLSWRVSQAVSEEDDRHEEAARLVLPVVARYVEVDIELTLAEPPNAVYAAGTTFKVDGITLKEGELKLSYRWLAEGRGWGWDEWAVRTQDGQVHELEPTTLGHSTVVDDEIHSWVLFQIPQGMEAEALLAQSVQVLVPGPWELELPHESKVRRE